MSRSLPEVVRLRFAPAPEYKRLLKEIEAGTPFNAKFYHPADECVREYHARGNLHILQQKIHSLEQEASIAHGRDRIQPLSNREVLEVYRDHFAVPYRNARSTMQWESSRLEASRLSLLKQEVDESATFT